MKPDRLVLGSGQIEWTMDITNDGVDRYRLTTNNDMGMYRGDELLRIEAKGYRADFDPNSIELAELLGKYLA